MSQALQEVEADHKARNTVRRVVGLYVGQLDAFEMDAFNRMIERGEAYRSYEYPGGVLGVAKVRLRDART